MKRHFIQSTVYGKNEVDVELLIKKNTNANLQDPSGNISPYIIKSWILQHFTVTVVDRLRLQRKPYATRSLTFYLFTSLFSLSWWFRGSKRKWRIGICIAEEFPSWKLLLKWRFRWSGDEPTDSVYCAFTSPWQSKEWFTVKESTRSIISSKEARDGFMSHLHLFMMT